MTKTYDAMVIGTRAPYIIIQRAVRVHSTVSGLIPTMLGELQPLSDGGGAPQWRTKT
jgi:hypothetical protein